MPYRGASFMMFSLSKKKDYRNPQELAETLDLHLNEIQEIIKNARNEKADLHSLIASVEKERSVVEADHSKMEAIHGGLSEMQQEFDQVSGKLNQASQDVERLDSVQKQTLMLESRLKRIEDGVERIAGGEEFIDTLGKKVDSLLEKLAGGGGNTIADGLKAISDVEQRQHKALAQLEKLEAQIASSTENASRNRTDCDEVAEAAETMKTRILELDREVDRFRIVKERIDNLNSLSEYVKTKIKALEGQRVVVDKANEEAGRLNSLTWRIDADLKQLQTKLGSLEKTEKNVSRIESMLQQSQSSIDEIRRFEQLKDEITKKIDDGMIVKDIKFYDRGRNYHFYETEIHYAMQRLTIQIHAGE